MIYVIFLTKIEHQNSPNNTEKKSFSYICYTAQGMNINEGKAKDISRTCGALLLYNFL